MAVTTFSLKEAADAQWYFLFIDFVTLLYLSYMNPRGLMVDNYTHYLCQNSFSHNNITMQQKTAWMDFRLTT
jgi:hypothetical protein